MSSTDPANTPNARVNLHCAGCNAQIGIFENEWLRLTSSYAKAQSIDVHFGTKIDEATQVVPPGVAQKAAEGCAMSEVFCNKCDLMVGQYCRSAPGVERQALVNQYFYKLSRTYLHDSKSGKRVEPMFGFGGDLTKSILKKPLQTARSTRASSRVPGTRWSETPLRTTGKKTNGVLRPSTRTKEVVVEVRGDDDPSDDTISHRGNSEQKEKVRDLAATVEKHQQKFINIQKEARAANSSLDARVTLFESITDEYDTKFSEQQMKIFEQNRRLASQEATIAAQDEKIEGLSQQIESLQDNLSDLKASVLELLEHRQDQRRVNKEDFLEAFGQLFHDMRNTNAGEAQVYALRRENQILREKVQWVSSALNLAPEHQAAVLTSSPTYNGNATFHLGKRKRDMHPLALEGESETANGHTEPGQPVQLPTPQSIASSQQRSAPVGSLSVPGLVWAKSPASAQNQARSQGPRLLAPKRIVSYQDNRQMVRTNGMTLHTFPPKRPPKPVVPPKAPVEQDIFINEKPEKSYRVVDGSQEGADLGPNPRKRVRPSGKKSDNQDKFQGKATEHSTTQTMRSVAPEPDSGLQAQRHGQTGITDLEALSAEVDPRHIDIDGALMITPENIDNFEQTDFEKDMPPRPVVDVQPTETQRERLKTELRRLGLAEWIDKDRNNSEYRTAVLAARIKEREEKRLQLLERTGFSVEPEVRPEEPTKPNGQTKDVSHGSPVTDEGSHGDSQSSTFNDAGNADSSFTSEVRSPVVHAKSLEVHQQSLSYDGAGSSSEEFQAGEERTENMDTDDSQDESYLPTWTRKPSQKLSTQAAQMQRRDQQAGEAMHQDSDNESD